MFSFPVRHQTPFLFFPSHASRWGTGDALKQQEAKHGELSWQQTCRVLCWPRTAFQLCRSCRGGIWCMKGSRWGCLSRWTVLKCLWSCSRPAPQASQQVQSWSLWSLFAPRVLLLLLLDTFFCNTGLFRSWLRSGECSQCYLASD